MTVRQRAARQRPHTIELEVARQVKCRYLLYQPQGYGERGERWPLVLFLHGAGERGDDVELVKKHGPPQLVEAGQQFPFVLVSPQCPTDELWSPEVLSRLLDHVVATEAIDIERVYVTGLSMGGWGAWMLASHRPDRFAAIAPICGPSMMMAARRIARLPVWMFHGAADETVPLSESELMADRIRAAGGWVRLTVYPEAGHDAWTETYANAELYAWLLRHRRGKPATEDAPLDVEAVAQLFSAIRMGDAQMLRALVTSRPNLVNARDAEGATALHRASLLGRQRLVNILIDAGADINARDHRWGATPAGWAIEYLRQRGALLGIEMSDMVHAAAAGDLGRVQQLLGVLPALANSQDEEGRSALGEAVAHGHGDIASLLRQHGANN